MKVLVIAREVAEEEFARFLELFEAECKNDQDRENVIEAIMAGRFTVDQTAETVIYTLARPVHLENGKSLESITLREPDSTDLEYINRGQKITVSSDGKTAVMDMSDVYIKTARMITQIGKVPLMLSDRIKRRDIAVLNSICSFFA